MIGSQIFLQGRYVEVGVAPNGSLGSTRLPPAGYHTRSPTFNFYDPGLAAFTGASNQRLMMVYDAGFDGWTTGTPTFFGDYSMPGTPYEGWGIQINGAHSEAQAQYFLGVSSGYNGAAGLTGANISYTNAGGVITGVWQGTAGALQITQTTVLDTLASWVKFKIKLRNTGGTPLVGVHYVRETDPDNDQTAAGGVMVTATGTLYTTQTLSLSAKDCRAKAFIHSGWPMNPAVNLATLWSTGWGGFNFVGPVTSDVAIGLVYNLGTIAAGDSTELSYAYVFNGLLGIDSALASPQVVVNGIARDTVDTVTSCSFSGSTLPMSIINGSTADWFGSTWTWAPSTYLSTTVGLTTTVNVMAITAPITYTITGTTAAAGCAGKTFLITILPPGATPTPTAPASLSYCLGSVAPPLSATGIGTIRWWTVPVGGVSSSIPPTPSTSAVGTTTYYVSQVVAGCPSVRIPIVVNIFALSTPITGNLLVCSGYTSTLANASTGGTWTSSNTAVATVGLSSGTVTGITPGTSNISYHVSGCITSVTVTVVAIPSAITGTFIACLGTTTTLNSTPAGGTWSSSNPAIASVLPSVGIVTGNSLGTATVSYSFGGACYSTATVSVNPFPAPITGSPSLCIGATTLLSSATPGGFWTSVPTTIASVGITSGVVTGITLGTATISYTVSGCRVTTSVSVISAAGPIVGPGTVCPGSTITLTNSTGGGTWTSGTTAVATIGSLTGVVTGITPGTTRITYAVSAGCTTSTVITVTAAPAAITGTTSACQGLTATLTHPSAGGTWASSNPAIASVGLGTGIVTAVSATPAPGTATITYTTAAGCITTTTFTVLPLPAPITGLLTFCQGINSTLSSATPGGAWTSGNPVVASIVSGTGVATGNTAGTAGITYTSTGGCVTTAVVTVTPVPTAITGTATVCVGSTTTLSTTTSPVAWSSSNTAIATVSGTGVVTGVTPGTATITAASVGGCTTTRVVTVTPTPAAITGSLTLCVGLTTTLSSTTTGGTWSVTPTTVATLLSPGFIGGNSAGTATVVYTAGGCSTSAVVTVSAAPGTISGTLTVCIGNNTTLSATPAGGTWSTPS
eukprot:gene23417-30349_t